MFPNTTKEVTMKSIFSASVGVAGLLAALVPAVAADMPVPQPTMFLKLVVMCSRRERYARRSTWVPMPVVRAWW